MSRAALRLVIVWLGLCLARGARANEPSFSLSWVRLDGAESCPGRAELEREVAQRLGRNPFLPDSERSLEVLASREEGRWLVQIHERDASGASLGSRTLDSRAEDCAPIFSATVLALALSADPDARLMPPEDSAAAAPEPPMAASRAPTPALPGAPSATTASPTLSAESAGMPQAPLEPAPQNLAPNALPGTPVLVAPPTRPPMDRAPAPASERRGQRLGFGAGPLLGVRLLPKSSLGARVRGSGRWRSGWGWQLDAIFLSARRTGSDVQPADFGIGLTAGSLGASYALAVDGFRAEIALGALAGALHVSVHSPSPLHNGPGDYFWSAARIGPTLTAALPAPFELGLGADLVLPITRQRFFLAGEDRPAFESDRAGVMAFLLLLVASD